MKKFDTLLTGVIYPSIEPYLPDYLDSIDNQTDKNFDLLILNHGLKLSTYQTFPQNTILKVVELNSTPAQIRATIISYAIKNDYDYLVFSDTDDYFSRSRVGLVRNGLKQYDFIYNELCIVSSERKNIQCDFLSKAGVKLEYSRFSDLLNRNIFGFTNTAVTVMKLNKLYIPKDLIAVDWWIFSILLLNGCKGGFIPKAKSYYRQSEINLIGIKQRLNDEKLHFGINVKINHYKHLLDYCKQNKFRKEINICTNKLEEMVELNKEIKNPRFMSKYIEVINRNYDEIFCGWWSEILSLNEWRKYEE